MSEYQPNPLDPGRRDLVDAMLVLIERAARRSTTIAVTAEAKRLLRAHPKGKMSLAEIETELAKLAAQRGVKVEHLNDTGR